MAQLQSGGRAEYSPCRDNTMSSVYAESFRKRWSAIRSAHWSLQTPPHQRPHALGAPPLRYTTPLGPASTPSPLCRVPPAHAGFLA